MLSIKTVRSILFAALAVVIVATVPTSSMAADGSLSGTISRIRVHATDHSDTWKPPTFWFNIEGITSAGNCGKAYGEVAWIMDSQQALSLVLAAKLSGTRVSVYYDDSITISNSFCRVRHITMVE